jgi:hypothetical protein
MMQRRRPGALALAAFLALGGARSAAAVVLDDGNRLTVRLTDGTDVTLLGAADSPKDYYYLPTGLHVSTTPSGQPEFTLIKFVTDPRAAEPRQAGANLHFLVTWGLTNGQETELRAKLLADHGNAQLRGAVPMQAATGDRPSFEIISSVLRDTKMTRSMIATATAPIMPGGRAAVSAILDPVGAQLLGVGLDGASAVADVSLSMNFAYDTQVPAAKGQIVADWSKVEREGDTIRAKWSQTPAGRESGNTSCFLWLCTSSEHNVYQSSYDEVRSQYHYLMEQNYIRFEFEETYPDERVAKIRDAFIQYFIDSMTNPQPAAAPAPATQPASGDDMPDIKQGQRYVFNRDRIKTLTERKVQTISMAYRLSVRQPWSLVGNLKSWYTAAQAYPGAVISADLSECLFQDPVKVGFSLDGVTGEMFGKAYNNVNVSFRKRNSSGGYVQDSKVIDRALFSANGGYLTFAFNPDRQNCEAAGAKAYEYRATWNVVQRGPWPADPPWQQGDLAGVALLGPLEAREIDFEGNLADLRASGFTRIQAELRYPQLGQEQTMTIQLPVASADAEAVKKTTLYMDRDAKGYVYRLILNHPTIPAPLALPWSARETDNYIYAYVPTELLQRAPAAVEAAKTAASHGDPGILARFDELLRGGHP